MRYRVVSECVVHADSPDEARASVTFDLDDGMRTDVCIATVEEMDPTQAELEAYYGSESASERLEQANEVMRTLK